MPTKRETTPQPVVEEKGVPQENILTKIIIIVILFSITFISGAMAKDSIVSAMPSRQEIPTEAIEGLFIDINGDGLEDYVVYADVIINDGKLNLTPGQ